MIEIKASFPVGIGDNTDETSVVISDEALKNEELAMIMCRRLLYEVWANINPDKKNPYEG